MTNYVWRDFTWILPPTALTQDSDMRLGEFVSSRQITKDLLAMKVGKYELLLPLCAIFLRKDGELFDEKFIYPGSDRLELMRSLPLDCAVEVGSRYDQLSTFINNSFPLFNPSKGKCGRHMKQHYDFYGWLEFLMEVAEAPQFLVQGSGMNGIECARQAKLYDVLLWASAKKERNEAEYLDHEAEMEKHK